MSAKSFNFGSCLVNTLASLCAILFIILTPLAFLTNNLVTTFFNPETYKRALEAQNLYERLPALAAEQMVYSLNYNPCLEDPEKCQGETPAEESGAPPEFIQHLTEQDWQNILSEIISPDWIKTQVERIIEQVFVYINSTQPRLEIKIPLTEIKDRLAGDAGLKAVIRFMKAQPECTIAQLDTLKQMMVTNISLDTIPVCNPPEELLTLLTPYIQDLLDAIVAKLPDEITLGNPPTAEGAPPSGTPDESDPRPGLMRIRTIIRLSPVLSILLIGLVTAFGVRSFKGLCWWWGIPILISGAILMIIAAASLPLLNWAINAVLVNGSLDFSGLTVNIYHAFLELVRYVGKAVGTRSGFQGIVAAFAGAVLITTGFFLKRSQTLIF